MTLASFNAAPDPEAVTAMLACCASHRFATAMAGARPSVAGRRGRRRGLARSGN